MATLLVILAAVVLVFGVETRQRSLESLANSLGETGPEPMVQLLPIREIS